jgi:Phosphodiester glycosidase
MLFIDGAIHPAFIVNSTDRKPRNGVGVSSPTAVHFVIIKGWVSFYEFARFFRDGLGCKNALFLDGGVAPGLYAPELGRNDPPAHGGFGLMESRGCFESASPSEFVHTTRFNTWSAVGGAQPSRNFGRRKNARKGSARFQVCCREAR